MIKLENVIKTYGNKAVSTNALNGINLEIKKGEFTAIIGTSGCGKTTLLNIIGCMDTLTSGSYYYNDTCVSSLKESQLHTFRKQNISFIFQHFELMNNYTVGENVEMPLLARGIKKSIRKEKVKTYLKSVGVLEHINKLPTQISGGQQQRCAIARALACETELIIADEPTGALDSKTATEIMKLFHDLNENGKTIILVTHDQQIANQCERIIEISDGLIINS